VPLITSELTISSSWSQPLQCCPSALARPPHCLTTYRYSNHTQQHFIHWCTQWDANSPTLHYNVTRAVNKQLTMISPTWTHITWHGHTHWSALTQGLFGPSRVADCMKHHHIAMPARHTAVCAMTSHNNYIPTCHEYLAKVTRRSPLNPLP